MRYAQIRKMDISNGLGVGVALFVQGCHFHCKNCFNPETWDFEGGKEFTLSNVADIVMLIQQDYITRFSVLGGEPLEKCNWLELGILLEDVKNAKPSIETWLYTGYKIEDIPSLIETYPKDSCSLQRLLDNVDVLVDGQFQEDKKDLTYPFAGSTNQRVINMRETRKQGKIVLLDI